MSTRVCWVVTDGRPGNENQCLGLAEALGDALRVEVKRIAARWPWSLLPPKLWLSPLHAVTPQSAPLSPPWPDLLIATGRISVAPAAAIKRAAGDRTFAVQIQSPHAGERTFDLIVVPRHDRLRGSNVIDTMGSLNRITKARLDEARQAFAGLLSALPEPRVAVLVGGSNKAFDMSPDIVSRLAEQLTRLHRQTGAGFMVTTSRRTGEENEAALRQALLDVPHVFWDGKSENPYFGYLAWADAIIVTADSVNMISESCTTGKPVYVVELPGHRRKFADFHKAFRDAGLTRNFDGDIASYSYEPLDETHRVANEIRRRMGR